MEFHLTHIFFSEIPILYKGKREATCGFNPGENFLNVIIRRDDNCMKQIRIEQF